MLSKPNESFDVGDVVVWGSLTYLVTDIDEDEQIQTKGKIQLCNNTLSFYSTTTSTLYSIPCIITNKITLNDSENNYLTSVDNQIFMMCSSSTTTRQIKPDDIFKLGTYNYQVLTVFDDVTIPGLLIFKMKYSEQEAVTHVFTTTIQNPDATLYIDNTLTLDVICTDNGSTVSSPTITYSSSDITVATVSSSGVVTCISVGTAIITATFNSISDTLNLTVQSEVIPDSYTVDVTGNSTVKLNSNITLTGTVFNNGVEDSSKSITWSFSNQDGSSNVYCTLVSSTGSSITLKATNNSSYVGKYVVVRASKSDNALIYKDFVVQIKSLI